MILRPTTSLTMTVRFGQRVPTWFYGLGFGFSLAQCLWGRCMSSIIV